MNKMNYSIIMITYITLVIGLFVIENQIQFIEANTFQSNKQLETKTSTELFNHLFDFKQLSRKPRTQNQLISTTNNNNNNNNQNQLSGSYHLNQADSTVHLTVPTKSTIGDQEKLLRPEKCIPIEIPLCKNIGYNLTYMPNAFNHETQEEAGLEVHQFYPLVEINCSEDLQLFLCSMYTPICLPNWHYRLTACKSLCESARKGCMPVMRTYGFGWPERMDCDLLPEGSECVSRSNTPNTHKSGPIVKDSNQNKQYVENGPTNEMQFESLKNFYKNLTFPNVLPTEIINQIQEQLTGNLMDNHMKESDRKNSILKDKTEEYMNPVICLPCRCRDPFVSWVKPPYNEVVTGGVSGCLPSCRSYAFGNQSDKTFAAFWLGLWAVMCILSTMATVTTFLADPGRFQYPERPIIYLSACYFMVALGYLIRVILGHEAIACDGPVLRRGTTGPVQCSVVFLLTYVFGMASSVWWVVLTLTWFLAAGLKWGTEAIAKYSQIYHFLAWFFPGAQAILVLILSAVDGDPVGGLCTVGSTNLIYLRLFVITPMCIYLGLGTVFLLVGFVALFKIRSAIKLQARGHMKTDKLEKLMIRIGIFGVLYTVPATVVIACLCYELSNREIWDKSHNCPCTYLPNMKDMTQENLMQKLKSLIVSSYTAHNRQDKKDSLLVHLQPPDYMSTSPEFAIFMLKYFMSLVVGITSGFWIWSSKTVDSWQTCIRRVFGRPCTPNSKRTANASMGVLIPTGPLYDGRSPTLNPAQYGRNAAQSKLWLNSSNPKLTAASNPTAWQDDFNLNNHFLPQTSSVSLTCGHNLGMHINHAIPINGLNGSVTGTPGVTISGLTANSGSFPSTPHDSTVLNSGQHHQGRKIESSNMLMLSPTPMTHI